MEPLEERTLLSVNPLGGEATLNTYTVGAQQLYDSGDAVAAMPDGGYVVTWASDGQDGSGKGVYARRFDAEGTPASDEFLVNSTTNWSQQRSSVAVDAEGGFVVVWDSYGQDGILAGVFAQRYNTQGQTVGGEFQVNGTSFGHQATPAVACLGDGGFVVVWSGQGNGDSWGVFGRRYDADGQADDGEFLINSATGNLQRSPSIAALPDSGFVVAWQSHGGQDGSGTGVFAQRFDADCDPVGNEFPVNTTTDDHQSNPAVAADAAGRFTIVWQSRGQDSGGYGVFAQRFDADGTPIGGEFQVNTYTSNDQEYPSVAYNADGGFVVSWSGNGEGDCHGVFACEFDADGNALGEEVLVNATTSQWQQYAKIANIDDEYVVVWSGKGPGDSQGVFMRRIGPSLSASGIADVSVAEDSADTTIDLSSSFADPNYSPLTYQITDNTDSSLFDSVSIDGNQLTLGYAADVSGSAEITVLATNSLGEFTETAFTVNIAPMNDAPTVLSFDAVNVAEDAPQLTINLGDVFQDIDDWFYALRFEIMSNDNLALFSSADFNDSCDALVLDFAPETSGTANIVLRAIDEEGLCAEATIPITVSAVNDAPVAAPATAVLARQDADPSLLDLATLFSDVDDPIANLSYEIIGNDNTSLVTTQLQGSQLTLSYALGMTGSATIVVRAADSAGHYDDGSYHTINVTVSATNLAPQITGLLDAPDPGIEGATLHLTAADVIDDTAVSYVSFWRDVDGDDVLDPAVDQLLGTDTDGSDGWQISVSSASFGIGTQRYFAQATDEDSQASNVVTATGTVGVVAVLDNSAAGYAESGTGWTDNASGGYLDTARRHKAGSGENSATWTFEGLMVKLHEVFITWKPESGLASNAQFSVYDGEQLLGTFSVDQRVTPNDANAEGGGWLKLGEYTITNGRLTVELTDAADGAVVADAVRLVDAPPTIESLSVTSTVTRPDDVTLTANNVADSDGTVVEVSFYRDTNGNSVFDSVTDELLDTDTNGGDGWSITADTTTFSTGTQTYFAIAVDNSSEESDPAWAQGVVEGPAVYGATSAYEGNTYSLQLDPTDIAITEWTIDWGDGTTDDVISGTARSYSHVYADGPNTWTIEVTGTDGVDTYYANQFDVDVLNVAPYLSVSGDATVTEGSQYTLNLSVDDPGADTITGWTISWGDGVVDEIQGNPSSVTHYYADGPDDYTIDALADDEDGTYWLLGGQAGALDYSFGTDGNVTTTIATGLGSDYGRVVTFDGDGKLLVAGYNSARDALLARYDADGDLDTSFGDNGRVVVDLGGYDSILAIGVQSNGKFVVGGYQIHSVDGVAIYDYLLARFNSDGTVDLSFGDGGKVLTTFGSRNYGWSLAIQPDDKILLTGYTNYGGGSYNIALARYTADGRQDPSFGDGGTVLTDLNGSSDYGRAITVQSDGKVLVAGYTYNGSNYDFALVRYEDDGDLDTTFGGGDGIVTTPIGAGNDEAYSVVVHSNTIVVAGRSHNGSNWDFAVARYNLSDGSLDTSFSTDGKHSFPIGAGDEVVYDVAVASNGDILMAGYSHNGSDYDLAIARYDVSADALDTAFDDDGRQTLSFGSSNDYGYSIVLDETNDLAYVAGYGYTSYYDDFAVACLDMSDGSLDTGFGGDGKIATDFQGGAYAKDVVVQADQKIVAAGYARVGSTNDFILVRYNTDGTLDTSFSSDGIENTNVYSWDNAYELALQDDQKIVAVGYSSSDFGVARYDTDGSLDTDFSGDGLIRQDIAGSTDYATDVAIQDDDCIVVAGYAYVSGTYDFAVVRFDEDGDLDTSFGGDGIVTTPIGAGSDYAGDVALLSNGKILVAGRTYNGTDYDFAVVCYNANGTLYEDFDGDDVQNPGNGIVTLDFGYGSDYIADMVVLDDGRILVAGYAMNDGDNDFAMACLNSDGTLDTSFGDNGIVLTPVQSGYHDYGQSLAVQSDGKILLTGYSNWPTYNYSLVRYNPDGSLDTTFDGDGKLTTDFNCDHDYGYGIAVQSDDRIVVSGMGGYDFQVARYLPGDVATTVTVENVAPTLSVDDQTVVVGCEFSLTDIGSFIDPGFYTETCSYTINWGDGSDPDQGTATIDVYGDDGVSTEGSFNGTHEYASTDVYTVTVTLSDGDNQDVETFYVTVRDSAVYTWDGGGANDFWMNGDNWVGDVAPLPGDKLYFTSGSAEEAENDFPDETVFESIEIASAPFELSGNSITLTDGITVNAAATGSEIIFDIQLDGSIEIDVATGADLTIYGELFGTGSLTKTGEGTLTVLGTNTYTEGSTVMAGTLVIGENATTLGGATVYGGTLQLAEGSEVDGDLTVAADGAVLFDGGIVTGDAMITGDVDLTVGTESHVDGIIYLQGGLSESTTLGTDQTMVCGGLVIERDVTIDGGTLDLSGGALEVDPVIGNGATLSGTLMNIGQIRAYGITPEYPLALYKLGGGTLTVLGTNTYTLGSTVVAGTLVIGENATTLGGATVHGGTLQMAEGSEVDGDLTVDADGAVLFDGGTLTDDATIVGDVDLTVGKVSEVEGTIYLQGGLSESTTVGAGQMMVCGGLVIQRDVTIDGGTLDLSGGTLEVDPYTGNGATLSGSLMNVGQIRAYGITPEYPLALYKLGEGTLTVLGTNTYTEGNTIIAGTLCVTGSTPGNVSISSGATLSGTGTVGAVTANGTVSPGVDGTGMLTTTGNIAFISGSSYNVDLTDAGNDQVDVTGTVTLGNADLNITSSRANIANDILVLVQNDGTDSITGTFLNLDEGDAVNTGYATYWITYCYNAEAETFGDGNDVALLNFRPMITAVSDTEIDLVWLNSINATGYKIERMTSTTTWMLLDTVGTGVTSYSDDDLPLTEGTAYYYRIVATIGSNDYYSNINNAFTLPTAPDNLAVSFVDGGEATLAWDDNSSAEVGYSIEQWIDGDWLQVQTADADAENATVTGVFEPSTSYDFRVRAYVYDFNGDPVYSLPSSDSETTADWPAAPTDLTVAAVSDTEIDLSWTDTTGETGYKIERSENGSTWTQIDTVAANVTSYSDTGVTEGEGTLRYYRVRATKSGVGDSAYTEVDYATTLPDTPVITNAQILSGNTVNLTWDDNSLIEDGYSIEQWINGEWQEIEYAAADAESISLLGTFQPTVQYKFRIKAHQELIDSNNISYSVYSAPSNEATVTALQWPEAPTKLLATVVSTSQIDLRWMSYDTSQTGYTVERSEDGANWSLVTTINDPDIKQCSDTGRTEGTLYYYRVQATNAIGGSGYSFDTAVPLLATPTGLSVNNITGSAVTLSWTDVSGHESGYAIQQLIDSEWQEIGWTDVDDTTATVEGIFAPSTQYSFRVQAYSDWSISDLSNTALGGPIAWPDAPTNLTAMAISGTEIDLSWTASTGATSYSIEMMDDEDGDWSVIGTVYAPDTEFDATGLSPDGTEYSFRVAAVNAYGSSPYAAFYNVPTDNSSPTIGTPAAGANPVTGISTTLSISANDDGGEGNLTYTWSIVSTPIGGSAWFSDNYSNEAKNTTVRFNAAGQYVFQVMAADVRGASDVSATLSVTVDQTLTDIDITPGNVAVLQGQIQQYSASGIDQFGDDMAATNVVWSLDSGCPGIIDSNGLYMTNDDGEVTVIATIGAISQSAGVSVKTYSPVSGEKEIGSSCTLTVESGAEVLCLGNHDYWQWGDNWDSIDVQLSWNVGGTSYYTVPATACLFFALAPNGATGPSPYEESVDACRPVWAVVPNGATSVTITASGTWGWYPNLASGPEGATQYEGPTASAYIDEYLNSENMTTISCHLNKLVGMWLGSDESLTETELLALTVADHSTPSNSATAITDAAIEDLFVAENQNGTAEIDFWASFAPSDAGDDICWRIDGTSLHGDFGDSDIIYDLALPVTESNRDFAVIAWLDEDQDDYQDVGEDSREVDVHVIELDADVDSNNDSGFTPPVDNVAEDQLEKDPTTGKIVWVNVGDIDGDMVIDKEDYDGIAGGHFVPMVLRLPGNINYAEPSDISITINYNSSKLRIWKPGKDASVSRSYSDIIYSGISIDASSIGLSPGGSVIVYIEAISTAYTPTPLPITVNATVTGAKWSGSLSDTVHVKTDILDICIDGIGEEYETSSGAIVWRNSDYSKENLDANNTIIPDYLVDTVTGDYKFDFQGYLDDYTPATVTWSPGLLTGRKLYISCPDNVIVWDVTNGVTPGITPPRYTSCSVVNPTTDHLDLLIEGLKSSIKVAANNIEVSVMGTFCNAKDIAKFTVVDVNAAVDGDRDNQIDFSNLSYYDQEMTFWYNNDQDYYDNEYWDGLNVNTDKIPVTSPDANDFYISNKRDLEDFAAYYVFEDSLLRSEDFINSFDITYSIYLDQDESDYPARINLFRQCYSGSVNCHIQDSETADWQWMMPDYNTCLIQDIEFDSETLRLSCDSDGVSRFIFEANGTSFASTKLTVKAIITYPHGESTPYANWRSTEITREVDLELRDITDFYDRWEVPATGPSGEDLRTQTSEELYNLIGSTSFADATCKASSGELYGQHFFDSNEYTVLVHGWNMPDFYKESFAQTAYKRLYWQGYQGRFGAFNWPTFYDAQGSRTWLPMIGYGSNATYNASELQAYRSGKALMDFLLARKTESYEVNLLAHSMGTYVAGEALRQWSVNNPTQALVNTYIAMEGAVSAGVYGVRTVPPTIPTNPLSALSIIYKTDYYGYWPHGYYDTPVDPCLFSGSNDAAENWVNMYNPVDLATASLWKKNNHWGKPGNWAPANIFNYDYDILTGTNYIRIDGDDNKTSLVLVDAQGGFGLNAYEILAFIAQANTLPIGTQVVGWFDHNVNIQGLGLEEDAADERAGHSFQFHNDAAMTWDFYAYIKQQTGFDATY